MEVRYARSGDSHLAYRVEGDGPALLEVSAMTFSMDAFELEPRARRYYERLRAFARLVQFDARGIGRSDPIDAACTLESAAHDALAVLDSAGIDEAYVFASGGSGPIALHVAAFAPERVLGLVLADTYARLIRDGDYPIGYPERLVESFVRDNVDPDAHWSTRDGADDVKLMAPSIADDPAFREWWGDAARRGASPYTAAVRLAMNVRADCRALLDRIVAPTVVIHRAGNQFIPAALGRYLAERISGARYVELPGDDSLWFAGDADALLDEVELFVAGRVGHAASERVLAAILFTDIVDSTALAVRLGDRRWREQLDAHDAVVREQLRRFGGDEINTTGDGFFASFDAPTRAVRCAQAVVAACRANGLRVRAGVHTGECERRGRDLAGLAVHIAARVAASGDGSTVVVSRTVRDAVAGSDLRFESLGVRELKGIDEPWELFAVS